MNATSNANRIADGMPTASKPPPTPLHLAVEHQESIRRHKDKIQADAACINRLLVGRTVRRLRELAEFTVVECRLGLSGAITVHGRPKGKDKGRMIALGGVREIEIVEPKP